MGGLPAVEQRLAPGRVHGGAGRAALGGDPPVDLAVLFVAEVVVFPVRPGHLAAVEGLRARDDRLGLERLLGPVPRHLRVEHPVEVLLEVEEVDDPQGLALSVREEFDLPPQFPLGDAAPRAIRR